MGMPKLAHGPCHWGVMPERMWSGTGSRGQRTTAGTKVRNCLQTHTHSGLGLCSNLTQLLTHLLASTLSKATRDTAPRKV